MSPNSSRFIEPHSSHHLFVLSRATTNLSFTSSPTQTMNHSLVIPSILINHTPPISSPYCPPTLRVNVGPQPYTFPNPLDHAHVKHFPFPILLVLTIGHDQNPQPTPIFSTHSQVPPKVFCPTYGCQFISQGLNFHQRSC